jgi:hypothetical protein
MFHSFNFSVNNAIRWQALLHIGVAGPSLSNRDILTLFYTAKALEGYEDFVDRRVYWTGSRLLYLSCNTLGITGKKNELQFHAKFKKTETKFLALRKNYNARCSRGASKQAGLLSDFLSKKFVLEPVYLLWLANLCHLLHVSLLLLHKLLIHLNCWRCHQF